MSRRFFRRSRAALAGLAVCGGLSGIALAATSVTAYAATGGTASASQSPILAHGGHSGLNFNVSLETGVVILNPHTGLALEVKYGSTAPGGLIDMWTDNYTTSQPNQRWLLEPSSVGVYDWIVNVNSGLCLTTDGVAGDQLYQEPCGSTSDPYVQAWGFDWNAYGDFSLVSTQNNDLLDVYQANPNVGAAVDIWPYNGGGWNQEFQFQGG